MSDEARIIDAQVWLAKAIRGAEADFWKVLLGKTHSIYAPTLDEFVKQAKAGTAGKGHNIEASEVFYRPFTYAMRIPVFEDAAGTEYRKVTWWRGVAVGEWVYVFYSPTNAPRSEFDNDAIDNKKFSPSAKKDHWRLAGKFSRKWMGARTITQKTMEYVHTKYTLPHALNGVNKLIGLLDQTARFIPGYAGAADFRDGETAWDKGMGVLLIAADLVPLAGSVRNASKTVRIGSQTFIAIGAGARIVNGVKDTLEGKANLGTAVDVIVAVVEGTVYTMSRVRLKLSVKGKQRPTDVVELMSILNTKPNARTPRPILPADDESAKRLAAYFKQRTAADIKARGLTPEELIQLLDANPNAVRAQVSRSRIKGRYKDGLPASADNVTPSRLDFDTSDASYWQAGKVLDKVDEGTGRIYQKRVFAKDLKGEKIIIDIDLSDHLHGAHKAPHYHIYRWKSGNWSKKKVGIPSGGQPGFPDVRNGIYIGPTAPVSK